MAQGVHVRRWLIAVLVLGLTALSARETSAADAPPALTPATKQDALYYGLTVFVGEQWHNDPIWYTSHYDWQEIQIRPVAGKHRTERWDLWLEGNLTYIKLEDLPESIELGIGVMNSYDVLPYKGWCLFGELGAGVGWMSASPDPHVVGDGVLGFLDYGIGIKLKTKQGYLFKIGPRFHHRSGLFVRDAGMNSYGLTVSVSK